MAWIRKKGEFADIVTTKNGDILLKEAATGTIYLVDHKTLQTDTIRVPLFVNKNHYKFGDTKLWYDARLNVVYLANSDGIAQYSLEKKISRNIPDQEIFGTTAPGQVILRSSTDNKGRIWLVKDKYGIRIINPETLRCTDSIPFGTKGLMQGFFTDISSGGSDLMLLRTLNGVVVYDYKKKHSFMFDNTNGLSYPDVPALLYCNSNLVIGLHNTIGYYNLRNLATNNFHPQPRVNVIKADTVVVFTRESGENRETILHHFQNTITFSFSAPEFIFPERIEYAYMLDGVNDDWQTAGYFNRDVTYNNLPPGKYVFHLKAQMQGGNWDDPAVDYTVIIKPAWWQTTSFRALCILLGVMVLFFSVQLRIQQIRREEKRKSLHEKQLMELEAKALRAQMNPHFIFNCLNSIKSLIQQNENEKSVIYLTTFSKLIRNLFNSADKKEISLYDEIETCKLYLQLEAMRFDTKFSYAVNVDDDIDLKSIQVPALIIQPFIENAIWHGIVPNNNGGKVSLNVLRKNDIIEVVIDDDGIGREASAQNKSVSALAHQSKGVNLTQSRLELNNLLQQREAKLEVIDKKDENGSATGTTIIIKIKEEQS